jgi:hypothetical protein
MTWLRILAALAWLLSVGAGMKLVLNHAAGKGVDATAPAEWPAGSAIELDARRPTLLMFAHPRCPCTRASIGELAVLMAKLDQRVSAHVLFAKPSGFEKDWEYTDRWNSAARIPGVAVHADTDRREAERFGSKTSGQVLLYAPSGRLLFSGGITPARAHMGDNAGSEQIARLVMRRSTQQTSSSVFGCPIFDEEP